MPESLKLRDFDFALPPELIAQTPAARRDESRLMVVNRASGDIRHDVFANLPQYLPGRPLLVFNNTRVIPAKLTGIRKDTDKPADLLLVREEAPSLWQGLIKGRLKTGTELVFGGGELTAVLVDKTDGKMVFRLRCAGTVEDVLERIGQAPLPPYICRDGEPGGDTRQSDLERYQTVYAREAGSIAAPTAGLHFTPQLLEAIGARHADMASVTLHVGLGTFQPVREEYVARHVMQKEKFHIPAGTWNSILNAKRHHQDILAVGTTSTRVLESVDIDAPAEQETTGWTGKFIYPGYEFKTVRRLLTNFHLPQSTLYLLVNAFAGQTLMARAYTEAIEKRYRFFSYGDAMLII